MRDAARDLTVEATRASPDVAARAVAVENADGASVFVLLCDHASNAIPSEYRDLGLPPAALVAHIAWDPGALGVAREMSRLLDAPLVHALASRLVVDCNRDPERADLVAETSEDIAVPGNRGLDAAERAKRVRAFHDPYHAAIDELLDARQARGMRSALVAVHSYTPVYRGTARPWEAGILFDSDRSLADRLVAGLRAAGIVVGENEPYSPADGVYYTLDRHAGRRGLASVMIEIRNDLVREEDEQHRWAARIAALLAPGGPARA